VGATTLSIEAKKHNSQHNNTALFCWVRHFCIVVLNVIMLDATRLIVMASPISFKIIPPDFYEPIPVFFCILKSFFYKHLWIKSKSNWNRTDHLFLLSHSSIKTLAKNVCLVWCTTFHCIVPWTLFIGSSLNTWCQNWHNSSLGNGTAHLHVIQK